MHTSAQASPTPTMSDGPDLFPTPPPAADGPQIEFRGELTRNAEVRHRPAPDGLHSVPVVCMELKSITGHPGRPSRICHAEQPFTFATRENAEALARTLTRGRVVTVLTPMDGMHITFPHVNSISIATNQDARAS